MSITTITCTYQITQEQVIQVKISMNILEITWEYHKMSMEMPVMVQTQDFMEKEYFTTMHKKNME